jgi:tRNA A-37 threonylcarbamoyl transferase component Bud32
MTGGEFIVNPDFEPLLREHGLNSFDKIMQHPSPTVMRSVPGRSTVRVQLGAQVAYLKRYEASYYSWWQRLLRRLGLGHDEAGQEWNMIHALRRRGFNTPTPIAFGRRGDSSFVMTLEIAGGVAADERVLKSDAKGRRALLEAIGKLTRRFHDARFIHKDYYLCHIFVVGREDADPELYFIDLQRVLGPRRVSSRWLVKDLGALGHSAHRIGVSRTDLLRAFSHYCGKSRLDADDRALAHEIMARMAWLHRRRPKYVGVWDDPKKSKAKY